MTGITLRSKYGKKKKKIAYHYTLIYLITTAAQFYLA